MSELLGGPTATSDDDTAFIAALCLSNYGQEEIESFDSEDANQIFRTEVSKIKLKEEIDNLYESRIVNTNNNITPSQVIQAYRILANQPSVAPSTITDVSREHKRRGDRFVRAVEEYKKPTRDSSKFEVELDNTEKLYSNFEILRRSGRRRTSTYTKHSTI